MPLRQDITMDIHYHLNQNSERATAIIISLKRNACLYAACRRTFHALVKHKRTPAIGVRYLYALTCKAEVVTNND